MRDLTDTEPILALDVLLDLVADGMPLADIPIDDPLITLLVNWRDEVRP